MPHSLKYYPASFIMRSKDSTTLRIIDLWKFRSSKSGKWYIVEVERFSNHFLGLKFYWKGVSASKKRYSLLTNDYEPRTIIMSCIHIMLHYFENDNCASFGFVAAEDINTVGSIVPNKRFRFYKRMMLSLFSPDKFVQVNDANCSIYLLVNKQMMFQNNITLHQIEKEISALYEGEYSLSPNEY